MIEDMIIKKDKREEDMREVFAEAPKKKKSRWKAATGITLVLVCLVAGVIYACGIFYFKDKFFTGTTINSIEASYDTVEEVEAIVASQVAKYRLLVKERGGSEDTIQAADIGYQYASAGEIKGFKEDQKAYKWPLMLVKSFSYEFASAATYNVSALKTAIDGLNCFNPQVEKAPEDAKLTFNGTTYELKKEQQGQKVIREKAEAVIRKAIETGKTTVDLDAEDCYEKPSLTSGDPVLRKKYERLYHYTSVRVTYDFGDQKETLDGSAINNWLNVDEDGTVTLDSDAVAEYVYGLAQKYDTYGKTRNFKTHDGSTVEVSGGAYGWLIDQNAENEQLLSILKDGLQVEREPVYAQTASTRRNCDLGNSYVEVDLSRQHLWMYRDGVVILECDFVSGDTSKGNTTPPGVYSLYYKTSPFVLKSDTPGDSYETPVTYWMPFNGGIGFHDASWRGSFGGNIYTYSGSHGCVNMPTWAAAQMYENISAGYPIICYYR